MLLQLKSGAKSIYPTLAAKGKRLADGLRRAEGYTVSQIGSLACVFFNKNSVETYSDAVESDTVMYGKYFRHMLNSGIYLAPAQFEAMFISTAHTDEDIDRTIDTAARF